MKKNPLLMYPNTHLDILPVLLAGGSLGTILAFFLNFLIMAYQRLGGATESEVAHYADRCYLQITTGCVLGWLATSLVWGFDLFTFAGPFSVFGVAIILTYITSGGRKYFAHHPGKQSG